MDYTGFVGSKVKQTGQVKYDDHLIHLGCYDRITQSGWYTHNRKLLLERAT